jgi:Sua5/YciO/YrdC/YwlC family protein
MAKTKIYSVNTDSFEEVIEETSLALKNGQIAAFPTETVYGLGAVVYDENAVLNIYRAKGRPPEKPLSILIGKAEEMNEIAQEVPKSARLLAENFWPGPLTIILMKKNDISDKVTAGKKTVGIRMPAHEIPLEILKRTGPLACPSANLSGGEEPTSAEDVLKDLENKIDILIDGGKTEIKIPSTIIDLTAVPPKILRKGGTDVMKIREIIGEVTE